MFGMDKRKDRRDGVWDESRDDRRGRAGASRAAWEDEPVELDADTSERVQRAVESVREFLLPTVKGMVNHPEAVRIDLTPGAKMVIATVRPAKSDIGYVIGRRGANADALRTLGAAITGRHGIGYLMEIVD